MGRGISICILAVHKVKRLEVGGCYPDGDGNIMGRMSHFVYHGVGEERNKAPLCLIIKKRS